MTAAAALGRTVSVSAKAPSTTPPTATTTVVAPCCSPADPLLLQRGRHRDAARSQQPRRSNQHFLTVNHAPGSETG